MSFQKLPVIRFLVVLFFLAAGQENAQAQCDVAGQVVDLSNNYGCGKVILSYENFEILVPVGDTLDLEVGTAIEFSYELSTDIVSCTAGDPVKITCLNVTSLPGPNCVSDFTYSVSYDGSPVVVFEPILLDTLHSYHWDFGDGHESNEPVVTHEYDEQGTYVVCLTLDGQGCVQEVSCDTLNLYECHASFSYESDNGEVSFYNESSGDFTDWEWSMGDGNSMVNVQLGSYTYSEVNIYNVCLTVWNNNGCTSKFCDYVFSGSGDMCDFTDCVLPGDTDASAAANVYDLLPIGVGYGEAGPPRADDAMIAMTWSPQYAPDWNVHTVNGYDYKHLDCNGDGKISDDDIEAIEINYKGADNVFTVQTPDAPVFWLDFQWDTIVIDDNTPAFIELEADLMAGTPDMPMENLRGFAMQLNYPEDKVMQGGIETDYYDNSFFGNSNDILWLNKDRYEEGGYLDLGFVRKAQHSTGFGKVASLEFIVIGDVIARDEQISYFTISLENLVAVNPDGALMTLGEVSDATLYVLNKTSVTETMYQDIDRQVSVFPNPASGQVSVRLSDLTGERLEVYDALGRRIYVREFYGNGTQLQVGEWPAGTYEVKVYTNQGIVHKRLIVR